MKQYNTGILFVHGIQGSPEQFNFLTDRVPEGVLVRNVLLPGHKAGIKAFSKVKSREWQAAVDRECEYMREKCEKLIFVGHSMGCMLGLLIEQRAKTFSSMILICCPFRVGFSIRCAVYSILAVTNIKTNNPFVNATRNSNGVWGKHLVSYLFTFPAYIQLFKVIRQTNRFPMLNTPADTVFAFSGRDEIVSKRSAAYARKHTNAEVKVFADGGHTYFTDEARHFLTERLEQTLGTVERT